MSAIPIHGPEERWRRTVDQRGRSLKLKVDRLLEEFGYAQLDPGVGEAIESRLAQVGLHVRPALRDVTADQVILLELTGPTAAAPTVAEASAHAPARLSATAQPSRAPAPGRPFERPPAPALAPAPTPSLPPDPVDVMDQSPLVRAAVEAERRVRNAFELAASAAADRIAGLERELEAERGATARARDERDELERRMHVERRESAARLQALSAAERTARGLLEAQRTELSNLTQTVRVTTAAIAQTRETLGGVRDQVQQTAVDVREALVANALADDDALPVAERSASQPPADRDSVEVDLHGKGDDSEAGAAGDSSVHRRGHDNDPDEADEDAAGQDTEAFAPIDDPDAPAQQSLTQIDGRERAAPAGELERMSEQEKRARQRAQERERARERGRGQERGRDERGAGRKGRGRGERLRRRGAFVCAVCGRPGKTREPEELVDAGWRVEGEVALCLTCVADEWKLGEGDTVPSRSHDVA